MVGFAIFSNARDTVTFKINTLVIKKLNIKKLNANKKISNDLKHSDSIFLDKIIKQDSK